jgi:hypothetical protein
MPFILLFYFKAIKHVINNFFISSEYNQNTLKTGNNPIQPLPTFPSKGSKSVFI